MSTAKKYAVLTWVAVTTTMAYIVSIVVLGTVMLGPFDFTANVLCLCFMTSFPDEYYPSVCACPIFCADRCCGCDESGISAVQRTVSKTMSLSHEETTR